MTTSTVLSSPLPISIATLVAAHESLFYHQTASTFTNPLFTDSRTIDHSLLCVYNEAYQKKHLNFARSHHLSEEHITYPTFPLLETLAWWIAHTLAQGSYHGLRSYVTPTSTFIAGARLGVAFIANEYLRIAYTFIPRNTVPPHDQIWPSITW